MGNDLVKLLIVDDEIGIRKGLRNFINWEQEGYQIVGDVANGKEALKLLRTIKPDIIISDIVMPEMDGVALMKALHKLFPEIGAVILSSYDDFKYVKTVMQYGADDYLLKASLTPNELLMMLKKVVSRRGLLKKSTGSSNATNNLSRYLSGFSSDTESESWDRQLNEKNGYIIMTEYSKFSNVEQERTDIHMMFQSQFVEAEVSLVSIGQMMVSLVQTTKEYKQIIESFKEITRTLIMKYPHLFFIHSNSIHNSEELKLAYETINKSMRQERFVNKNLSMVSIEQLAPIEDLSTFDMKYYLLKLTNRQFEGALAYLEQYFFENDEKNLEEANLRNLVTNAIYNYLSSLEEVYGESEELSQLKLNVLNTLNNINYLADFKGVFDDIQHQLLRFTERVAITYDARLTQSLESYIKEHSSEKITLRELAEEFHFSYSYLSSYFSTKMNETFSDFLNRIRIDKASDLLKATSMNISEISQEVGYSDVSYFSKVFKKIKGQTPLKYRRRPMK